MKKKFELTLEFEAEINEEISEEKEKRFKHFEKLFALFLQNDCSILEIYRAMLMSDLENGNHLGIIEKGLHVFQEKNEDEIVKSVIQLLPAGNRDEFLEILKNKNEKTEEFFDYFLEQFGDLKIKKVDFLPI